MLLGAGYILSGMLEILLISTLSPLVEILDLITF